MEVVWMRQAENAMLQTAAYIGQEYGLRYKQLFLQKVFQVGLLLETNPYLGQLEPLLREYSCGYRSIVVSRLNKIVYRIANDRIEIADFWDTRREPAMQSEQISDDECRMPQNPLL